MEKSSLKINADSKSALADTTSKPAADLTLAQRVMAPTPKFFCVLRTIGVVIGLVGGAILASPLALPAVVVTVGVIWCWQVAL
jgi:hypothetical protein